MLQCEMARRPAAVAWVVAVFVFVWWSDFAHAQVVTADTEYTAERFRLSVDRRGILGVESADVPDQWSWDVGLWVGYADDPLNLYRTENGDRERVASLVSRRVAGGLVAALSLFDRLQLGVAAPVILNQDQDTNGIAGPPASISRGGLGDLRIVPKLQLLTHEDQFLDVAVILGFVLPTGTSEDYFGDGRAMLQPELAISRPIGSRFRFGVNVGYRARKQRRALNLEVDDEIYAHAGAALMLTKHIELDVTYSGATAAEELFDTFNRNHSEMRGGLAVYAGQVVLFAAGGVGIAEGFGTPDWRAVGGIRLGNIREGSRAIEPGPNDADGDGLLDDADECPDEPENFNQWEDDDGCPEKIPDSDGDGLNDRIDECQSEPEDVDSFEDGNGCPDPDNDQDGVVDDKDECPLEPGAIENRGCPDADSDGDTVVDRRDNCPNEPGDPENAGCKVKQVVKIVDGKLELLDKVYFRTNKAVIRKVSYRLLRNVAEVLNNHPEIKTIHVEGHTDSRGGDAYNKKLSQRRAESVVDFLVNEGVNRRRLDPIGYGEEQPIDSNNTKEGRAANRRVEFKLQDGDGANIKNNDSGPTDDTIDE